MVNKHENFVKTEQEYICKANYVRMSPFKLRRIAKLIRRKDVTEALSILKNLPQLGSGILIKTINSAVANYKDRTKNDDNDLYISELIINGGPLIKRHQPRARGRIFQILKRNSHISVSLKKLKGDS